MILWHFLLKLAMQGRKSYCWLMGVIEFNTSSICVGRVKTNCLVEKNRTRRIACTASSVPVQEERQQKQCVTGDAFIRPHLRKLSPYQPILPFEVNMLDQSYFFAVWLITFVYSIYRWRSFNWLYCMRKSQSILNLILCWLNRLNN